MDYNGKYKIFDPNRIITYPISARTNRVTVKDLILPDDVNRIDIALPDQTCSDIDKIAGAIVIAGKAGQPVIVFAGAHLIKNGLGLLLIDLINRRLVTLIAGTGATAIHDFELALVGQTSENVPGSLDKGQFGMAYEFAYINCAISIGHKNKLGFGESLGKMICDENFRNEVLAMAAKKESPRKFLHPEISVLAACYKGGIPFTIHAGIGTDVTDQHPSFDGQAKGGCSGRDFLIYINEITKLTKGGMVLNIGSAVTGPEVFLKAVSMAANVGSSPAGIIVADFDLRDYKADEVSDESAQGYYFRDQKSVVTRIPQAFDGKGFYIQGDQKKTFPLLYKRVIEKLNL